MRKTLRRIAFVTGILPMAATAADVVQLNPGRWSETYAVPRVTLDGRSLPYHPSQKFKESRFSCMSQEEARDPSMYFIMKNAPWHDCVRPKGGVAHGLITIVEQCTIDEGVPTTIGVDGTYFQDAYHVTTSMKAMMKGAPLVITQSVDGRYAGACRGDEEE